MPLAEPADDQTTIRRPDVESWQHLSPPTLERRLQIARALGDIHRIGTYTRVLCAWLNQWLRSRHGSAQARRSNCHGEQQAKPSGLPFLRYPRRGIRKFAVERMTAR